MTVYRKAGIELRLGDYREVLGDVEADAVITDPPYSERTHNGQRSVLPKDRRGGPAAGGIKAIPYSHGGSLPEWATPEWWVVFGDHQSWIAHERALQARGLYVFQPVVWCKPDPTPRLAGDGPCSAVEYLCVARPKRRVRRSASRPGLYWYQTANTQEGLSLVGRKPLPLMRAIVRDYSEPDDLIMDCYAGTGTTLIAAAMEGRRAIGAELDPKTYELACKRIERTAISPPLFQDEVPKMIQEKIW